MDKVFAVAGVSTLEGVVKARFAKDLGRIKVLEKNGHTDVKLVELPKEMTKTEALQFLRSHEDFQDSDVQAALWEGEGKSEEAPAKPVQKVKTVAKAKSEKSKAVPKETATVPVAHAADHAAPKKAEKNWIKNWEKTRATVGEQMLADAAKKLDDIEFQKPAFLKKDMV